MYVNLVSVCMFIISIVLINLFYRYNASLQNGYLGVNWDNSIKEISPLIYNFESSYGMSMRALRLVGIGLNELPNDISNKLRNLEILSLANK